MKLLFDENLSRRLVPSAQTLFPDSAHVSELGLSGATDREVWAYAGQYGYVVISKDSDFNDLAFMHGPPPKVIWLRIGNTKTDDIAVLLNNEAERIHTFGSNDQDAVLVLGPRPEPSATDAR